MNKYECGSIQFKNDIEVSIEKSEFTNNHIKSYGGAICLYDIIDLKLNLVSSNFTRNEAKNGGAIYFSENKKVKGIYGSPTINLKNNIFRNNVAENFGGAIYSEYNKLYLTNSLNNEISFNKAGMTGGGIYSPNFVNETVFDLINWRIFNNSVNAVDNQYTSKPCLIKLNKTSSLEEKIYPGGYFNLKFYLLDEFNNTITDINKYYSSLLLKVIITKKNQNAEQKYKVSGNIVSFSNDKFEFNNLRIFGDTGTYILKFSSENIDSEVQFEPKELEIFLSDCDENQIKMKDDEGIINCEDPICSPTCPLKSLRAKCKKAANAEKYKNDMNQNICECEKGYGGTDCSIQLLADYSSIDRIVIFVNGPTLSLIILYTIFIIFYRYKGIIRDPGYYKTLIFTFGIFCFFISNLFATYRTYLECSLNFLFKYVGISLTIGIYYICNSLCYILGSRPKNEVKFHFSSYDLNEDDLEVPESMLNNESSAYDLKNISSKYLLTSSKSKSKMNLSQSLSNLDAPEMNEDFLKKIKEAHSLFYEIISTYAIFYVTIVLTVIINNDNKERNNLKLENSGNFIYRCNLENYEVIFFFIELFFYAVILYRGKHLFKYNCVFKYTKYITYSSFIAVIFGPTVNIICYAIFRKNRFNRIIAETILNSLCYFVIFIFFSWDKVYYILAKKGDEFTTYFIYKRHEYCPTHHSKVCGCKSNMSKENLLANVENFIDFYKVCSTLFEIEDGKIRFLKVDIQEKA